MTETMIERLARVLEPNTFKQHESFKSFCIDKGDSEETAQSSADWAHPLDVAYKKARAAIEEMRVPTDMIRNTARHSQNSKGTNVADIKPILDNLRQWLRVARGFSRPSPSPFESGMADYIADYTNDMVADQPAHAPSIADLAAILAYIDGLERNVK